MLRRLTIVASLLVVLFLTTWPLHRYVGHSHWERVEWLPFARGVVTIDFVANVALFIPFGLAVGWPGEPRRVRHAVIAGAVVSMLAETYQVYCHAFPTTADVLANTLGVWLGATSGRLRRYVSADTAESPSAEDTDTASASRGSVDRPSAASADT